MTQIGQASAVVGRLKNLFLYIPLPIACAMAARFIAVISSLPHMLFGHERTALACLSFWA